MRVRLGSILYEEKKTISKPDGGEFDLIGVSNEIGLHVSRAARISDLSRYKLIKKNWFAYNPMRVNVGSIGFVKSDEHIGIVSPDYVVFSCSEKILPEYLLYLLKSDEGIEAINKNASGAVRKRLYFSNLAKIEIVLPSIEDQKRILTSFRKTAYLKSTISSETKTESLIQKLRQSILQEAIEGKLTSDWRKQNPTVEPASELLKRTTAEKERLIRDGKIKNERSLLPIAEDEAPFELPKGWIWCRLGDVSRYIQRGKSPKYVSKSSVPVLSQKCIQWKGLEFNKARFISEESILHYSQERFLKDEDLLWNSTGDGTVGRLIKFKNTTGFEKVVVDSHVTIIRLLEGIKPDFVFVFLSSRTVQENLSVTGSTKQTELGRGTVINHLVPVPPFAEQEVIVEKVVALLEKSRCLETEITHSEQLAQKLMQAVLKEAFSPVETFEVTHELKTVAPDIIQCATQEAL